MYRDEAKESPCALILCQTRLEFWKTVKEISKEHHPHHIQVACVSYTKTKHQRKITCKTATSSHLHMYLRLIATHCHIFASFNFLSIADAIKYGHYTEMFANI